MTIPGRGPIINFVMRRNKEGEAQAINASLMGDHHRSLILRLIQKHGPMSRAEIARTLGLAPSVVSRFVRELLSDGCLVETERAKTSAGRRPVLLEFNPNYGTAIGAHLQRHKAECALVNMGGDILSRWELPFPARPHPEDVLPRLAQAVNALRQDNTLGVGVAVSGLVDLQTGEDVFSPVLEWREVALKGFIEENCGLPVHVENDANALAMAELLHGAARNFSDFMCVMVGEGLGSGIVIGGRLHRGAFGGAGELGHTSITIDEDAPLCRCGERGCLEEFCSNRALNRQAEALGYPDWRALAAAARKGDPQAKSIFHRFGHLLGLGIRNVVNIVNPQAVIIGGELMEASDLFFDTTAEVIQKHAFPSGKTAPAVLPWQVGETGFLVGAAGLIEEEFLSSPIRG